MGAFLLCSGTPGKRSSLPNARIMIHQPLGGAQGQAADIEIQAKEILYTKALLNKFMSESTGPKEATKAPLMSLMSLQLPTPVHFSTQSALLGLR